MTMMVFEKLWSVTQPFQALAFLLFCSLFGLEGNKQQTLRRARLALRAQRERLELFNGKKSNQRSTRSERYRQTTQKAAHV